MSKLLKLTALISLWSLVAFVLITVDPYLIRDVGLPGLYLPFMALVYVAVLYTGVLVLHRLVRAGLIALLIVVALELSIQRFMYWYIALSLISTIVLIATFPHRRDLTGHSEP